MRCSIEYLTLYLQNNSRVKGVVSMKLKPVMKKELKAKEETTPKKSPKKKENKLPPDEYTPMFEPKRILVR